MYRNTWKSLKDYVLLDINTIEDKISEVCCMKVVNDEIVETYYRKGSLIEDFDNFRAFIGKNYIVGWCIDFDIGKIQNECPIYFGTKYVDVFEPYYRSLKDSIIPCSLKSVYYYQYERIPSFVEYDFTDVKDKCKATKQLYDSQKHLNYVLYVESKKIRKKW